MKVVGVDLGAKRIGVAVSDSAGQVALPHRTLERSGDRERDRAVIAALVAEVGAEAVVVGLPVSLDGSLGPAARDVLREAEELAAELDVPVETHDERLTTVSASRALVDAGVRSARRRRVVDQSAAAVMLQSWLDRGRR
jgi:putative Holliday junction resolvase